MTKTLTPLNENQLSSSSTEELKKHLSSSLDMTARHLRYMAMIWRELEQRGEDLSELRHGIASYLPMIANNLVDANIVIQFAGQKTLLSALSSLPIAEQKKITEAGYVTVVKTDGDKTAEIQTPLSRLKAADIHQVFAEDRVREPVDQIRLIERRNVKQKRPLSYRKARRVKVDKTNNVLLVGNSAADIERVVEQLSEYYNLDLASLIEQSK